MWISNVKKAVLLESRVKNKETNDWLDTLNI